jgi:hypothetical protein
VTSRPQPAFDIDPLVNLFYYALPSPPTGHGLVVCEIVGQLICASSLVQKIQAIIEWQTLSIRLYLIGEGGGVQGIYFLISTA